MPVPTSKHRSSGRRLGAYTDFTTLTQVSPGAALILAAEHDRIIRGRGYKPTTVDLDKWNPEVYAIFRDLGFFELLGVNEKQLLSMSTPKVSSATEVVIMPMKSGSNVKVGEAGQAIVDLFLRVGGAEQLRVQLLGAVVDAIENVRDHAYRKGPETAATLNRIPNLWWVSGGANIKTRKLTLSIYDQGLTIPRTLPYNWAPDILRQVFLRLFNRNWSGDEREDDGRAIDAAIQLSTTATGKDNRGKGLSKIRSAVSMCDGGKLRVISRHGDYIFENGADRYTFLEIPLLGTYLEIEASF